MPSSITLTVKQLPTSTSFFLSALQPLDYVYRGRVGNTIGFGLPDSPPDFWISQEEPGVPAGAAHVAFPARSQKKVQEFFIAALKAGGKCHGEPLLRDPSTGYYSAAIIDFDGNSIEAVHRPDLVDEGYGSGPSSISSVASVKSKVMSSKAPTTISKATTVKPKSTAPTEVKSVAPSSASKSPTQISKAPTQASKAPSAVSKAPTSASKSPTQVSKAPTTAPSQASRAPSAAPTQVSRAPSGAAPSQVSRAPTAAPTQVSRTPSQFSQSPPPQPQAVTYTTPQGEVVTNFVTEARGAISIAKQLVNEVRPALEQSNSAPNIHTATRQNSDPNSHKPSDTIVGTLLGVAAGAALTYAYTKANESDKKRDDSALAYGAPPPPQLVRTTTEPPYSSERAIYYQEYTGTQPYAIEAPPSEYAPSGVGSQRYITLQDNDERLSDYAQSQRPRRRSSFSGVDVRSFASSSRASQNPASQARLLEAPPTSYRAPTAITMADSSTSHRSKSRTGSSHRSSSESRSHASRRSSAGSKAPSYAGSDARTVVPAKSTASRATTVRPEDKTLPPSRAGTFVSKSPTEYMSTHSKANKTVVGKMLDRERTGGRSELTKSVVGKIEDAAHLNVPDREVDPSDSVSQVSSVRSKRSSKR